MAALLSIKSPSVETIEAGYNSEFSSKANLYQQNGNGNGNRKFGVSNPGLEIDSDVDAEKKGVTVLDSATGFPVDPEKDNGTKKEVPEVKKGCFRQYGGMLLTLGASFLFSLVILLVKMLQAYGFEAEDASFWRYAGITIPSIPLLFYFECKHKKNNEKGIKTKTGQPGSVFDTIWPLNRRDKWITVAGLLSRGILGSMSVILRYFALEYLTIGDTSVISYSSPVLVTILAHFFLGEKTGWIPVLSAVLTLCGVVVITQPPILTGKDSFDNKTLVGTGLAVGSLICSALMTIITRKIREVQFALMLLIFGSIGMIISFILSQLLTGFSLPHGSTDTLMLVGVAGLSFVGQMFIILALKFEQAGPVALIRTCDVVFGFILQFIFLGVYPSLFSAIGGSIVFLAIIVTATRKYVSTLPKEHWFRRIFGILLY